MIPTNSAKMKKFWEVRVPSSKKTGWFDKELPFGPFAQLWADKFFFSKNLALPVIRYHGQLSSCTISEKSNGSILRKLRWTDEWTEDRGQRDESDFIGHCLTSSVQYIFMK